MAKIKLVVSATIGETFSDFIISKQTKGLAEKTLQSYQAQFQAVARHLDVKMDIAMLQKADLDAINQASYVEDGAKIIIPKKGENKNSNEAGADASETSVGYTSG